MAAGFTNLKPKGNFLIANSDKKAGERPHIGQIKISFEYDRCSKATVVA